jgi:hypothetical protein
MPRPFRILRAIHRGPGCVLAPTHQRHHIIDISEPKKLTPPLTAQTYNSLGQSPCAVAAYLQSVCGHGGAANDLAISFPRFFHKDRRAVFTIPTLTSEGTVYTGPTGPSDEDDLCKCNTVVYSLMSACGACQGSNWFSCVPRPPLSFLILSRRSDGTIRRWNTWKQNCTSVDASQTYVSTRLFFFSSFVSLLLTTDGWLLAGHAPGSRTPSRMGRACKSGRS